ITKGMYVTPRDIIIESQDNHQTHFELLVFEKDILNSKAGQKIHFKIPEASNDIFEAEVYLVGTSTDAKTRIVKVHGHIKDEDNYNFIVGMFIEADIKKHISFCEVLPIDEIVDIDNY